MASDQTTMYCLICGEVAPCSDHVYSAPVPIYRGVADQPTDHNTTYEPDYVCHQFQWWVCGSDMRRQGPMDYARAKLLLARQPAMWMEIVPA